MTTTSAIVSATTGTGIASAVLAEAAGQPWWLAAIVVPLAGFAAYLVHWILQKQDQRDKENAAREAKREEREEKRAEQSELQTRALQDCVGELKRMNEVQVDQAKLLEELPARIAELVDERKSA